MLTYRYCKYGKDKKLALETGANRELSVDFSANQPKYIILSDGQIRVSYKLFILSSARSLCNLIPQYEKNPCVVRKCLGGGLE